MTAEEAKEFIKELTELTLKYRITLEVDRGQGRSRKLKPNTKGGYRYSLDGIGALSYCFWEGDEE